MTEIAFHFNVPDKLDYACRLLRKAVGTGARLVVTAESGLLAKLDVALWTFAPLDFIPHCRAGSDAAMLAVTPVVLAESALAAPHHEILVNLGTKVAEGFERFERLIEVVDMQEDDRLLARTRWKHYADRGYVITRVNRGERGAG